MSFKAIAHSQLLGKLLSLLSHREGALQRLVPPDEARSMAEDAAWEECCMYGDKGCTRSQSPLLDIPQTQNQVELSEEKGRGCVSRTRHS